MCSCCAAPPPFRPGNVTAGRCSSPGNCPVRIRLVLSVLFLIRLAAPAWLPDPICGRAAGWTWRLPMPGGIVTPDRFNPVLFVPVRLPEPETFETPELIRLRLVFGTVNDGLRFNEPRLK